MPSAIPRARSRPASRARLAAVRPSASRAAAAASLRLALSSSIVAMVVSSELARAHRYGTAEGVDAASPRGPQDLDVGDLDLDLGGLVAVLVCDLEVGEPGAREEVGIAADVGVAEPHDDRN